MSALPESNGDKDTRPPRQKPRRISLTPGALLLALLANLLILALIFWGQPFLQNRQNTTPSPSVQTRTLTATASQTSTETATPTATFPATLEPNQGVSLNGLIVLSLTEAGYAHLFAYNPESLPLTRLTGGGWDDIQPALSPDGTKLAFASHRGGQWDIYLLDLTTGGTTQFTDSLAYDGAPAWSPDGVWLAFESYVDNNLEIFISLADGSIDPVRLTFHGSLDYGPAWSPTGRLIAFTSNHSGAEDIWLANLDVVGEERFTNLTDNPALNQSHPAWSPDGESLAWVTDEDGMRAIYRQEAGEDGASPLYLASGEYPVWSPDGAVLLTPLLINGETSLAGYRADTRNLVLPPLSLPGQLRGLSWGVNALPGRLPLALAAIATQTIEASWEAAPTPSTASGFGRQATVELEDVIAPHPELNALAVPAFEALRKRLATEAGWDVLAALENAFLPITEPLPQGLERDWLYTGRAFSLSPVLIDLGWMLVAKEEIGAQTFWRVYLRAEAQDGSLGRPLTQLPWNFDARFSGDPQDYEAGGAPYEAVPAGYWIDLTALAQAFGWERLPALSNWRSFMPGARFNEFAYTTGLDWETAMLQLYPPEALTTPGP